MLKLLLFPLFIKGNIGGVPFKKIKLLGLFDGSGNVAMLKIF